MDIIWTKTPLAMIATSPSYTDVPGGQPTTPPTDQTKLSIALKLLSVGGTRVVILDDEREGFRRWLTAMGKRSDQQPIRTVLGEANNCHRNCAQLWSRNSKNWSIVPGYGLSEDGMWRQHTWLLDDMNIIVETTIPRIAYFGVKIDGVDAQRFHDVVMS